MNIDEVTHLHHLILLIQQCLPVHSRVLGYEKCINLLKA